VPRVKSDVYVNEIALPTDVAGAPVMVESKLLSTCVVAVLLLVRLKTRVSVRLTNAVPEDTCTTTSEPWTAVTVP
jgi:hypothetical protein